MGEDALRALNQYISEHNRILAVLHTELPNVRAATHWVSTLLKPRKPK
jgi:hypothetical protein